MIGTGKVKLATADMEPEAILTDFYSIMHSSRNIAKFYADKVLAKKGDGRKVISPGTTVDIADEGISDRIEADIPEKYLDRICEVISNFTSEFKRRCAIGFFMANGTTIRYPGFKLKVDTDDTQKNVENEKLNELILGFNEREDSLLQEQIENLNEYIASLPAPIKQFFLTRYEGFYDLGNSVGNIKRSIQRAYKENGIPVTDEKVEEFMEVIRAYRAAKSRHNEPRATVVCDYLGISNESYKKYTAEALQPIISVAPERIVRDIVNGE